MWLTSMSQAYESKYKERMGTLKEADLPLHPLLDVYDI